MLLIPVCCNTIKLRETLKASEYQRLRESVAWLRAKTSGMVIISWITIGNPQPSSCRRYDKPMEKVQRVDGCAVEGASHSR